MSQRKDAGDEVLVAFVAGDPRKPVVIGALRNGKERPPETNPGRTLLQTTHGARIVFDDGTGALEIADSNANAVKLAAKGVTVTAAARGEGHGDNGRDRGGGAPGVGNVM